MALEIHKPEAGEPPEVWIADRRLYLTKDKRFIVEHGDGRAAFLLCAPGQRVSRAKLKDLRFLDAEERPGFAPPAEAKEQPKPADKARRKAPTKRRKKRGA